MDAVADGSSVCVTTQNLMDQGEQGTDLDLNLASVEVENCVVQNGEATVTVRNQHSEAVNISQAEILANGTTIQKNTTKK
jgi:archaellum component FlaF (FlaF/FlaG flagellin family)